MNSPPSVALSPPNVPPSKKEDWSEHTTSDGRKYFFNKITRTTTWDKPDVLKTTAELSMGSCPWKEYASDSGKKYYYNSDTQKSVWEAPPEFKTYLTALQQAQQQPPEEIKEVEEQIEDKKKETPYATKQEAKDAFLQLLESAGVTSSWTWEKAMRAVINDDRWKALKTLAEKKHAFSEYIANRRRLEREDKRRKELHLKEEFMKMLSQCQQVTPRTTFKKTIPLIEHDARYLAIESERDREEYYEDYLYELDKKLKEEARQQRKDNMLAFLAALRTSPLSQVKPEGPLPQWRKVKDQFAGETTFSLLDPLDRLTVFEDFIRELERKQMEEERISKEKQKRDARKARDAFRALLLEKLNSGEVSVKSKWKDFLPTIKETEAYKALLPLTAQDISVNDPGKLETSGPRSLPQELFFDFQEEYEDKFHKEKRNLKDLLKELGVTVHSQTKLEEFKNALMSDDRTKNFDSRIYDQLFDDLMEKAISREKKRIKTKKTNDSRIHGTPQAPQHDRLNFMGRD